MVGRMEGIHSSFQSSTQAPGTNQLKFNIVKLLHVF